MNAPPTDLLPENKVRSPAPGVRSTPVSSRLVQFGLLAAATAVVFMAGGPVEGSLGIFLIALGGMMIVFRPAKAISWSWFAIFTGIIGCAALALLPRAWIATPEWRLAIEAAAVIEVGDRITPVPRETLFWLTLLGCSAGGLLFSLAHPLRSRSMLWLSCLAVVVCAGYAGLAIYSAQSGWIYPYDGEATTFGFFPNKNHTGTLMAIGGLVAVGLFCVSLQRKRVLPALLAAVGLVVCAVALFFFCNSRGGFVALIVASGLWLAGLGRAHYSRPLVISFGVLLVGGLLLFFGSPGVVRDRIINLAERGLGPIEATPEEKIDGVEPFQPPLDFRSLVFADTIGLIRDFPWTGTGLGAFPHVFSQYRDRSLAEVRILHPESDWLMLVAEAGLPVLLFVGIALGLAGRRLWRWRSHPYWPLRWGIVCAALAALLHGLVDVPAHRVALGWWVLVIAGLGLQSFDPDANRSRLQWAIFVLVGMLSLGTGIRLVRAEWYGGPTLPPFVAGKASDEIIRLYQVGEKKAAVEMAERTIQEAPMSGFLYYQLGASLLRFAGTDEAVDKAFAAQRLLTPWSSVVPMKQGNAWMLYSPARSVALWREAIKRREAQDEKMPPERTSGLFSELLREARNEVAILRPLRPLAEQRPSWILAWLGAVPPELATTEFRRLVIDPEMIAGLTAVERRQMLAVWYAKGDRDQLFDFVEHQPDWEAAARPVRLRRLADAGEWEAACRQAMTEYGIDLSLREPGDEAGDTSDSLPAFASAWSKGNTVAALRLLEEAAAAPDAPVEVWRLRAAMDVKEGRWQPAWENLRRLVRARKLDDL